MIGIRQIIVECIRRINTDLILGNVDLGEWANSTTIQIGRIWERGTIFEEGPVIYIEMGMNESALNPDFDVKGKSKVNDSEYSFTIFLLHKWNNSMAVLPDSPFRMEEIIPYLDEEEAVADIINRNLLDYMSTYIKEQALPFRLYTNKGVFTEYLENHRLTVEGWIALTLIGTVKKASIGC